MRPSLPAPALILAALAVAANLDAQTDACPGMDETQAALVGYVTDPGLGGLPVMGAVVTAQWRSGDEPETTEVMVPDDGVYLICGVPQGVEVTLQATFSGRQGPVVEIDVVEEAVRQDLTVSLAGGSADDAPLLIGPGNRGFCPDLRVPQAMIRCIMIEDCTYVRLGRVTARKIGAGRDSRELVERFIREARKLEVDAVRGVNATYEQRGQEIVLVAIEGTGIEFTEERCKAWVTNPFVS